MLTGHSFSVRTRPASRCEDIDLVNNMPHASHARRELLCNLLQVVRTQATAQVEYVVTGEARDVTERQIATRAEPLLGLAIDLGGSLAEKPRSMRRRNCRGFHAAISWI